VKLPVQLGFTLYVPEYVSSRELPATTRVWVPLTWPFPSKVILPAAATGTNVPGAMATNPLAVYPELPATLANEHCAAWAGRAMVTNKARPMTARVVLAIKLLFIFCSPHEDFRA
jgi:hypothetical protein